MRVKTESELTTERNCYGCTQEELDVILSQAVKWYHGSKAFLAMSILSDVQELMSLGAPGDLETARQYVNRAKYLLKDYVETEVGVS